MKIYLHLVLFLLLTSINSFAAVTLTTATGGSAISADNTGTTFVSLTGPVIAEATNGEIGAGTIIINAPLGVLFDITGTAPSVLLTRLTGSGGSARNINGAATGTSIPITSITTTQITFTVTSASNSGVTCSLTWQNIRARPNTGAAGSGNLTASGTSAITGIVSGTTNLGTVTVVAGAFTKMQTLVPGETTAPGTPSGKTGTPSVEQAGTVFSFTVNAVDAYWNVVNNTNTVAITSSDVNATLPANAALVAGTKTYSLTFKTVGSFTVTATNYTDATKTANTSPSISSTVGVFTKLQILLPGESAAPGTATGKTGSPSAQTAGSSFIVTVNAVDANWNLVNTIVDNIGISSSDPNAVLPANSVLASGTKTYSLTCKTAGSITVTASDITDGTKTASTSPSTLINAGAFVKMQLIVPGETAAPGTATGKTGVPAAQNKGTGFSVTVNSVDANWNIVNITHTIGISSSDAAATLPSNAALVAGTQNYAITLNTSGTATITATNITDGTKTAATSPSISIVLSVIGTALGGNSISADNTGLGYTSLTGPTFTEGSSGNVGTGTIILNAPSGVIFDIGGTAPNLLMNRVAGSGANALNINGLADGSTIALTSISTTQITFTISTASSSAVYCKITFQNVRVRPNTGAAGSGNLTLSGTAVLTGVTSGVTNFGTLTVVAGAFSKMQLLVPGETAAPGSGSGKTGTPSAQASGTSFSITVNAVDAYWNIASSTHTVGITSTDVNAILPGNTALVAGTQTLSINLKTVGSKTITATNITDGTKTAATSPPITVNTGTFTQLQLLLPGEIAAPGTTTGKTGTPTAQTAGSAFSVTVNAVDAAWNIVNSTHTCGISSSDVYASLPSNAALVAGSQTYLVTLKSGGTSTLTANDITDGTKTACTSPNITVNIGAFAKLQILVPGETAAPGSTTGKTGSADAQSRTRAFNVIVNAVDANWNLVSSIHTVGITSTDVAATLPVNAPMAGGTASFTITLGTAGSQTLTATDITDGTKTANTSASINVVLSSLNVATGGSSISADNTGLSWTPITGPVYTEGTSGDVGVGAIVLNAPAGVVFDIGGTAPSILVTRITGSGGATRNINSITSGSSFAITSITTTQITATITGASNAGSINSLTWQNIRVRPNTGAAGSGNIICTGSSTMTGISGSTNFGTFTVVPGVFTKMQLLVPGETKVAGTASGKTGTPIAQTAGTSFNVTVNAVDAYWNITTGITNTAGITSSDVNATMPANAALVAGTQTFSVTLISSGSCTLTATNITDGTKTANTSPAITLNGGAYSKLQILLPGETASPGSATGKTGTPTAATSGTSFVATVNAVDANWNVVATATNTISISATDANASLPSNAALSSGTFAFTITLKTAGTSTLTATDVTDGTKTANTSPTTTVNAGVFTKMQLLVPGETSSPGSTTGKTGTPSGQTPGTAFTVTVNAVDANWNLVTSTHTIGITSSDAGAALPTNAALVAGTKTFSITLNNLGNWNITATNITDGTKTANTSPSVSAGPISWTGGAGTTFWGDAANWSPAGVPTSSNNLNLTGANTIQINVNAVCNNLTLNNSGLSLTINAGFSLAVSGNFTLTSGSFSTLASFPSVTGTTSLNGGTVSYSGSAAQTISALSYVNLTLGNSGVKTFATGTTNISGNLTISGSATTNCTTNNSTLNFNGAAAQTITGTGSYNNLIINNSTGVSIASASGSQTIGGTLTLTAGALTTNGNTFTLLSTSGGTARIDGTGTGTVSGTLSMQRYISGAAGYRYLTSPLSGTTISSLQPAIRLDGMTGVTSPGHTNYWCNLYEYNEAATGAFAKGWTAETNVANALSNGKGYAQYLYSSTVFPVTLILQGTLARGAKTLPVTYRNNGDIDQGWNFVGNPYPSTIDWDAAGWTRTNIQGNTYYVWDNAAQQYATYPAGGPGVNGGTRYIASSQGFMVRANGVSPVLSLTENTKVSNNQSFWKVASQQAPFIKIKLSGSANTISDESLLRFVSGATSKRDSAYDAYKVASTNANAPYLATQSSDSSSLAINTFDTLSNKLSVPILVRAGVSGTYTLSLLNFSGIPANSCIAIEDLQTKAITNIMDSTYTFTLSATTNPTNRFLLHIALPILQTSTSPESCNGTISGSISLTPSQSTTYSYSLKNAAGTVINSDTSVSGAVSLYNLKGGLYALNYSQAGSLCPSKNDFINVPILPPLSATLNGKPVTCKNGYNGTIKAVATGGTGNYLYKWSTGDSSAKLINIKTGLYSIVLSDETGCATTDKYTVNYGDSAIFAGIKTDYDTVSGKQNNSIQFTSTSTIANLNSWTFGDLTASIANNPMHSFSSPGTYYVTLVSSNTLCTDTARHTVTVQGFITGQEPEKENKIKTYMLNNTLIIELEINQSDMLDLSIQNMLGQPIYKLTQVPAHGKIQIPFQEYPNGIYLLNLNNNEKRIGTKRFSHTNQ
jgi:hypothetical protein